MAHVAEFSIGGIAPLSFSRYYEAPKKEKETPLAYDERTWRERLHYDDKGMVFIPKMALKWCLTDAAQMLGMKVVGRGRATFTSIFTSGILVLDDMPLGLPKDKIQSERLFVPSNGKRGSGTRVWRTFPLVPHPWKVDCRVYVLNKLITREIFAEHLAEAGRFIGLGRFRPQRGGFYGRFALDGKLKWTEEKEEEIAA